MVYSADILQCGLEVTHFDSENAVRYMHNIVLMITKRKINYNVEDSEGIQCIQCVSFKQFFSVLRIS